jgi:hypothetical protein
MKAYTIDPADAICKCGHWTEEHDGGGSYIVNGAPFTPSGVGCSGCEASGIYDDKGNVWPEMLPVEHAFVLDDEQSSPEMIAERGGEPDLWPQYVKDYFAA